MGRVAAHVLDSEHPLLADVLLKELPGRLQRGRKSLRTLCISICMFSDTSLVVLPDSLQRTASALNTLFSQLSSSKNFHGACSVKMPFLTDLQVRRFILSSEVSPTVQLQGLAVSALWSD